MATDAEVRKQLARFEFVEWHYEKVGGKVVQWAREHGGTSEDPNAQAFVVTADGATVTRASYETAYTPALFAKWLAERADAIAVELPKTKAPFATAVLAAQGEGPTRKWRCPALDEARGAATPVLLYVGRGDRAQDDEAGKAQSAASRKFEKAALDSQAVADASETWLLLRLNTAFPDHAEFARSLGVEAAPALLAFLPGEAKPTDLGTRITADSLAHKLRKAASTKR